MNSPFPLPSTTAQVGLPPALGARWNGHATTIGVPVGHDVDRVDVAVFDPTTLAEISRFPLPDRLGDIVWGSTISLPPGSLYGLRVTGNGYDPLRLMVDPYALAIAGNVDWVSVPEILSPTAAARLALAPRDTASLMPKCVVVDQHFDWQNDQRPAHSWTDTIIIETHVKNATQLHPDVPQHLRGSYAGLAHPAFIDHLTTLGVTSIELLPVHQRTDEERLAGLGLINHWGYNTLGFFAPEHRYSASGSLGEQVSEFKGMVKLLHAAGIEVILDVVYNHSCEGGAGGAALSLRGLDRHGWYRPEDVTGCGNTIDQREPAALRLILESLRYWVTEMHVDGFRFDLAPAISRGDFGFSSESAFLSAVAADPLLTSVKLIAEPWDIGVGGYQVGGFPAPWAEWNDRYRDTIRDLWRGAPQSYGSVAGRIAGSSDIFAGSRRKPWASVNFVAAHDGMTMRDLCTYNQKHNQANGEDNRDGSNDNRSWNCGVEGPTDDPEIQRLRRRQHKNLMATLMVSQGTPMFLSGDELGNTQRGNNNAYCQDNEISWIHWAATDQDLLQFTQRLIRLRRDNPSLRLGRWLIDQIDAKWLTTAGKPMTPEQWNDEGAAGLTLWLTPNEGTPVVVVINDDFGERSFVLPATSRTWQLAIATDDKLDASVADRATFSARSEIVLIGRSMAVFVEHDGAL